MSEEEPRRDDRPFLGRSIENGRVRFSSVSAIQMHDPETDGGCFRKGFYRYVKGLKEAKKTKSKETGDASTKKLERYLKTGEMTLPPMLLVGKRLLPLPGPDLEVEKPLGDIAKALTLRDAFLKTGVQTYNDDACRLAGLSAGGVPLVGAADVRHRRGCYVDPEGNLLAERPEHGKVAEVIDHKTIGHIDEIRKGTGEIVPSYVKTGPKLLYDTQMLGYAVNIGNVYPDVNHVRLSHVYYQTKGAKKAKKTTTLIPIRIARERWSRLDDVVGKIELYAKAENAEDVEPNERACSAYSFITPEGIYRKGCMHQDYCPINRATVHYRELGIGESREGERMGLYEQLQKPTTVEIGTEVPPPPPPMDEATHAAETEIEKAKLRALMSGVPPPPPPSTRELPEGYSAVCNGRGHYTNGQGFIAVEVGHSCAACIGAINPPDALKNVSLLDAADPLPPEEIAKIIDPALKAEVEKHAKEHAERAAKEKADKAAQAGTAVVYCGGSAQRVTITAEIALAKKWVCTCTKEYTIGRLKPAKQADGTHFAIIPKHKPENVTVAPPPPPVQDTPPPPPSDYVAPGALSGQMAMEVVVPPPPLVTWDDRAQPPAPPAPPPPPPVGEMTAMVNDLFGPANTSSPPSPPTNGHAVETLGEALARMDAVVVQAAEAWYEVQNAQPPASIAAVRDCEMRLHGAVGAFKKFFRDVQGA